MAALEQVTVALDWTPNTNHVGFYVAQALGLYSEQGLAVRFVSPHSDNYEITPASRVAAHEATLGLGPSETLFSYHSLSERPNLIAVATILQQDLSSIATLKQSGIERPQQLDGKRYASYGARYEGRIVQKMIQNDGGQGEFREVVPVKLGIWNTLLQGEADATWVFSGWEGCAAAIAGIELNELRLSDYGIPYGYSPVVFCHPDSVKSSEATLSKFLHATEKGFAWASRTHSADVTTLFLDQVAKEHPDLPEGTVPEELVRESVHYMKGHFLRDVDGRWGRMDPSVWEGFLSWLQREGLLTTYIQSRSPVPGKSVSLDELRQGNAGAPINPDRFQLENIYTNMFLELEV